MLFSLRRRYCSATPKFNCQTVQMSKNMKKIIQLTLILGNFLFAASASGTEVGEAAPPFSLPKLTDNIPVALSQYTNQVIYLDFWASWCAPCRTSFPLLNELFEKYQKQGFEVVAVNLDEDLDDAQKFLAELPVTFTILHDAEGQWAEKYGIESMPTSFIIDKHGVVQHVHNGFSKADIGKLENKIASLLEQQ